MLPILIAAALAVAPPSPRFEDRTAEQGVDVTWRASGSTSDLAAGIAFFELDSDGWIDLVVADVAGTDAVYRNQGPPDYTFEKVDVPALAKPLRTHALLAADLVGDSAVDLLLLPETPALRPTLLVGQLDGSFRDESATRLLLSRSMYFSATAGDFDQDGDLDLVLTRYASGVAIVESDCISGVYVHNAGGRLVADPERSAKLAGCGLAALATRLPGGGGLDIVQINDYGPWFRGNTVLRNDGLGADGRVRLAPLDHALGAGVFGMGAAVGDLNGDGLLDYFATSVGEDLLVMGTEDGRGEDATDRWRAGTRYGDGHYRTKWGAAFADLNNSGDSDLVVLAGKIAFWPGQMTNSLLVGSGEPPLVHVGVDSGLGGELADRSLSVGDVDGDGLLDLAITGMATSRVLRNVTEASGHWVGLRPRGTVSDTHAIGARFVVRCGDRRWHREQTGGGSLGGSPGRGVHVGLGDCSGAASVDVTWPAGRTSHHDLDLDVWQEVVEPEWLVLSATRAPADGSSEIEVRWIPEDGSAVSWSSSLGQVDSPSLSAGPDGALVGTLVAPSTEGEAVLSFEVGGVGAAVHPRVRFAGAPETRWAQHPWPASAGDSIRVGVALAGADGEGVGGDVEIAIQGGAWIAPPIAGGGGWVGVARADEGATEVRFRARVDGADVGEEWVATLVPRFDPGLGRIELARVRGGETVLVDVLLRETAGGTSFREQSIADALELTSDGAPVPATFGFGVLFTYTAAVAAADLGGEISVALDGRPVAGSVRLPPVSFGPERIDPEQSSLAFFERHVYSDGAEVVPVRVVLRDADGLELPVVEGRVALELTGGGEFLSIQSVNDLFHWATAWVRPDPSQPSGRASVLFDGQPIGLEATVPIVDRSDAGPNIETIDVSLFDPVTFSPMDGIRVGSAGAALELVPRDSAGAPSGAGGGLSIELDPGVVGDLSHVGFGAWVAAVAPHPQACTATLVIRTASPDTERTVSLRYLDAGGGVVDAPCGRDSGGCGVSGNDAGGSPARALLLLLAFALWTRGRR